MKPRISFVPHLVILALAVLGFFLSPSAYGQSASPACTAANMPTNVSAWLSGPGTAVSVVDVSSVLAQGSTSLSPVCQIDVSSTPVNTGEGYPLIVSPIAFSSDGRYAYVVNENFGSFWKISTADGSIVSSTGPFYSPLGVTTTGIVVSPNQSQVYVASNNLVVNGGLQDVTSVFAVTADGKTFLGFLNVDSLTITGITTSTVDGHIYVSTPTKLFQITPGVPPVIDSGIAISSAANATQALVASPDGGTVYILGDNQITPFAVASHTAMPPVPLPPIISEYVANSLAITPDGATLYIGYSGLERVYAYNISSGSFVETGAGHNGLEDPYLAVSPDNSVAYILNSQSASPFLSLTFLNPATQDVFTTLDLEAVPLSFGLSLTGQPVSIQVNPPSATGPFGSTQQFTPTVAGSANKNVTWIASCNSTANNAQCSSGSYGSITPGGVYSAPTGAPYDATSYIIADWTGSANWPAGTSPTGFATFTIANAPLQITTQSLPSGQVGTAYSAGLVASGGVPPYSWSIASGNLPPGIALNSATGALSGTPTAANSYTIMPQVSDSGTPPQAVKGPALTFTIASQTVTGIQVLPNVQQLSLSTAAITSSQVFYALDNTGAYTPVTWTLNPPAGAGTLTAVDDRSTTYTAPTVALPAGTMITLIATSTINQSLKGSSQPFTLSSNNTLGACCVQSGVTLSVNTTAGGSGTVGAQLIGVPAAGPNSTIPFALSCMNLPPGAACIFSLKGSSISSITGQSSKADCTILTTGPASTASEIPVKLPGGPWKPVSFFVGLCCLLAAFALALLDRSEGLGGKRTISFTFAASVLIVVATVGLMSSCGGFSTANVAQPQAIVTPAGSYAVHILATPPAGNSGNFVQSQLIVPLNVAPGN